MSVLSSRNPFGFVAVLLNMNGHFTGTLKRGSYELVASGEVDKRLTLGWGRNLSLLICFVVCSD